MNKPTNIVDQNCESKSSNCVIWDGPDIECIGLCKGETVTKVVYALAEKVCELEAALDIEEYDITAMVTEFGPVPDFKTMIQNLITKAYSS